MVLTAKNIENGWLAFARRVDSQNCDDRPDDTDIDCLVIHNISLPPEEFGGGYIEQLFTNKLDCSIHPYFERLANLKVSSHFLIDRMGKLTQFVAINQRAWHAGQSSFCGRQACNDFSLGVELEGSDHQPFTIAQYRMLGKLHNSLAERYPVLWNREHIVGHSDIAPGRKTDPGPFFDWHYFFELAGIATDK